MEIIAKKETMLKYFIITIFAVFFSVPFVSAEGNFDELYGQKKELLEKIFSRLRDTKNDKEKAAEFFDCLNRAIVDKKDSELLKLYLLSDKILGFVRGKIQIEDGKDDFIPDEFYFRTSRLFSEIVEKNIKEFYPVMNEFYYGGEVDLENAVEAKNSFMAAARKFNRSYRDISINVSSYSHKRMTYFRNSLFLSQDKSTAVLQYESFANVLGENGTILFRKKEYAGKTIWIPVKETSKRFFMSCD